MAFSGPDATDEEIARLVTVAWDCIEQLKAALQSLSTVDFSSRQRAQGRHLGRARESPRYVAVKPPVGTWGMPGRRRSSLLVEAHSDAIAVAARLGEQAVASRRTRGLTQKQLGAKVGLDRSRISQLERGLGAGASLAAWVAVGRALDRPLRADLARDGQAPPVDAGHLAVQELLLRLARAAGRSRFIELATRPSDPARSSDVVARDDRAHVIILQEAWNSIGDIGAGLRSSARKAADADGAAILAGNDDGPYRVASCWVVRATLRNRALVVRYPEVFSTAFPGSSGAWVRALTTSTAPPMEPGLVWCNVAATRLFAWRRAATPRAAPP